MTPQRFLLLLSLATLAAFGQTPPAKSEVGIFRQGFYWILDVNGDHQMILPPDIGLPFGGVSGDIPIAGDWNGDGLTEVGIYRPSNGLFILDTNGNGQMDAEDQVFKFWPTVLAGAIPVVGDWNGDGRTKVGLFYQGYEWILDYNGDGAYEAGIDKVYAYGGIAGDIPVVGDWTGTGTSKIGIYRPSSSGGPSWLLDANGDGVFAGADFLYYFGNVGDVPVVGDWSGSGTSKVGVFRGGNEWLLDVTGDGIYDTGDLAFYYGGVPQDVPVVGKWNATEQPTDTQPVCVSSSGSCTATPQGQALPVMNSNVVSSTLSQSNPPYTTLTVQFTNSNGYAAVAGGQILVNVDMTTPPAALNGCYIEWYASFPPGQQPAFDLYMPDAISQYAYIGMGPGAPPVYDNHCGFAASASSVTYSGSTITLNLALYFQPGFSGPHAVYVSGASSGYLSSPWLNLGTLGIQPPPAMPAITTLAPQYVTIAPSASNTQIPLAYLGFNTPTGPITLSAAPVSDSNGNMLTATFQQSPATGSTTMTMSAPPNMRPGTYNMFVTGRDTTTGATSTRDVSTTITSTPTFYISSDGVPVYITDLPNGETCTGGDSTFGLFSQPDPFLPSDTSWSAYSLGGGANQYQINCPRVIYTVFILTPGPPLIYDVQSALTGSTPTCSQTYPCNSVAVDSTGSLDLPGENLTANGQTPRPTITSDDPNISFSLLWANPGYAVVNYTVGANATTGLHTLTLTTVAGEATQGYIVGDAYPVLTSIPPGTFQVNSAAYTLVTINGMHLGTNCPTINTSNSGIASFTVTGPCTDTSVVGNLQAVSPGTATFTAAGAGYNGNGFVPQQGTSPSPGLQVPITNDAGCAAPLITSLSVNGASTNAVILGTSGTISVYGGCLGGTTSVALPTGLVLQSFSVISIRQVNVSFTSQVTSSPGGNLTVTSAAGSTPFAMQTLTVTLKSFAFTNSVQYSRDCLGASTPMITQPTWPAPTTAACPLTLYAGDHAVFVEGTAMGGKATFSVTPAPTQMVPGLYAQGTTASNGMFTGSQGAMIAAGSPTFTAVVANFSLVPVSPTQFINPLNINWCVGQGSASSGSCVGLGASSNPVYVTLAPSVLPDWAGPIQLSYVAVAVGTGGATSYATAIANTWSAFTTVAPMGVMTWDHRAMAYYTAGFDSCAVDAGHLVKNLSAGGAPTGSGQCGAFAFLLESALAVNGIHSTFITIQAADFISSGTMMVINNWSVPNSSLASYLNQSPWIYQMILGSGDLMVPGPPGYGDLETALGLAGQNNVNPLEKVFQRHFIVQVPPPQGSGQYYDPSYGQQYSSPAAFESHSVVGYVRYFGSDSLGGTNYHFRTIGTDTSPSPNILFLPLPPAASM